MRDDSHRWDAPSSDPEVFLGPDLRIVQVWPTRQVLLSGADALTKTDLPLVEWPGNAPEDGFALVMRRDRILEVGGCERTDGWSDDLACAVSDMTDAYEVLHLDGAGALELLKRGGVVNPDLPSRSTSRPLFGLPVLLYRRAGENSFAIHVGRANMQILRKAVTEALGAMNPKGVS